MSSERVPTGAKLLPSATPGFIILYWRLWDQEEVPPYPGWLSLLLSLKFVNNSSLVVVGHTSSSEHTGKSKKYTWRKLIVSHCSPASMYTLFPEAALSSVADVTPELERLTCRPPGGASGLDGRSSGCGCRGNRSSRAISAGRPSASGRKCLSPAEPPAQGWVAATGTGAAQPRRHRQDKQSDGFFSFFDISGESLFHFCQQSYTYKDRFGGVESLSGNWMLFLLYRVDRSCQSASRAKIWKAKHILLLHGLCIQHWGNMQCSQAPP